MSRLLLTLALVTAACSSDDGSGGTGGASSGGAAGSVGSGGVSSGGSGGTPSDAGCVDFSACATCLTSQCATELKACDAVPGCLQAQFDQADCLQKCVPASSCWSNLEVSGGSNAKALRACAKSACAECQP